MTKESPRFKEIVEEAMHQYKNGKLKNGSDGKVVKDRIQAVALRIYLHLLKPHWISLNNIHILSPIIPQYN
jgi:hypothetical protein